MESIGCDLCSAFYPSKCTRAHTHTHREQWAAIFAVAPMEQLRAHLRRGIEGGRERSPPTISAGTETQTCDHWVTSLTLEATAAPMNLEYSKLDLGCADIV